MIWRTLGGRYDIGEFTFLTTSIQQASSNLQQVFSRPPASPTRHSSSPTCFAFFEMKPTVISKPRWPPRSGKD